MFLQDEGEKYLWAGSFPPIAFWFKSLLLQWAEFLYSVTVSWSWLNIWECYYLRSWGQWYLNNTLNFSSRPSAHLIASGGCPQFRSYLLTLNHYILTNSVCHGPVLWLQPIRGRGRSLGSRKHIRGALLAWGSHRGAEGASKVREASSEDACPYRVLRIIRITKDSPLSPKAQGDNQVPPTLSTTFLVHGVRWHWWPLQQDFLMLW